MISSHVSLPRLLVYCQSNFLVEAQLLSKFVATSQRGGSMISCGREGKPGCRHVWGCAGMP